MQAPRRELRGILLRSWPVLGECLFGEQRSAPLSVVTLALLFFFTPPFLTFEP
jgi:hypothetical protein